MDLFILAILSAAAGFSVVGVWDLSRRMNQVEVRLEALQPRATEPSPGRDHGGYPR